LRRWRRTQRPLGYDLQFFSWQKSHYMRNEWRREEN